MMSLTNINLVVIYRDGIGTNVDLDQAFYWLEKAKKQICTTTKLLPLRPNRHPAGDDRQPRQTHLERAL